MQMTTISNISTLKMANDTNDVDFSGSVDFRFGIFGTVLTIFFFQLLNRLVIWMGTPKSVPLTDEWKWRNLVISWIHALICGSWDLSCFILFPDMFEDLITFSNMYIYSMVTFSAGYFLYDFIDMYINNKLFKMWEVTLHHIAVGGMFLYNILACTCIGYNCIALLAEVNSFFLHSRKLLQMLHVDFNHWFYRLATLTNLVTFVVFRGLSVVGILVGMYLWRTRVPLIYYLSLGASMFVMTVMNPILFYRLLKNDFLRYSQNKESSKISHANGVNNNIKHEKEL